MENPRAQTPDDPHEMILPGQGEKDRNLMAHTRWWKGSRGEWYVVAQFAIFFLIAFGPRSWPGLPAWGYTFERIGSVAGICLLLLGLLLTAAGFFSLGKSLSVLPRPKEKARLVETGAYRLVRHPIYSGIFFASLGWGLSVHGWLTIGYATLLFIVLDLKAHREERWLLEKFPEYAAYQKRVRRLIPFIY
jgi:protein-S-isoprenylcysteine O-methyltransferase Ste14